MKYLSFLITSFFICVSASAITAEEAVQRTLVGKVKAEKQRLEFLQQQSNLVISILGTEIESSADRGECKAWIIDGSPTDRNVVSKHFSDQGYKLEYTKDDRVDGDHLPIIRVSWCKEAK